MTDDAAANLGLPLSFSADATGSSDLDLLSLQMEDKWI